MTKAYNFNLIVHMERLFSDKAYAKQIERFFGVEGLWKYHHGAYCEAESKLINEKVPLVIQNTTLEDLYHRNHADHNLFRELVDCPDGIHFPEQSLSDFVET
jgi:hypothetical protein